MMTGVTPLSHNVYINAKPVSDQFETIAEICSKAGFSTIASVACFVLHPALSNLGQGFDHFFCEEKGVRAASQVTKDLLDWFEKGPKGKAFVWTHFFDCHAPYSPVYPYNLLYSAPIRWRTVKKENSKHLKKAASKGERKSNLLSSKPFLDRPPFNKHYKNWLGNITEIETVEMMYRATITEVDKQIERIFTAISLRYDLDNIQVIVTSDHGESFGEHEIYFDHWGPYEPNTDIPLLMMTPKLTGPIISEDLVSTLDIGPTLCDLAGLAIPNSYEGQSLISALLDNAFIPRDYLICETADQGAISIQDKDVKLILPLKALPFFPQDPEMYKIKDDLLEEKNLILENSERKQQLLNKIREWEEEIKTNKKLIPSLPTYTEDLKERLEALGYLSE